MVALLVNLLIISVLIFFLHKITAKDLLKPLFIPALIVKLLAGIFLGLIYEYHYQGGDTFNYFHDAVIISDTAFKSPELFFKIIFSRSVPEEVYNLLIYADDPRALVTGKILSFFTLITGNKYWLSGVYLSLFSFSGMWYLANKLAYHYPQTRWAAAFGFLFFPSVLIWSSGVLKESLIMGALAFLVGFFIDLIKGYKGNFIVKIILSVFFMWLLWQLKYYYLAVLISVTITSVLVILLYKRNLKISKKPYYLYLFWIIIFTLILGASSLLFPTLRAEHFLFFLLHTHDTIYANSAPENLIHYNDLSADFLSIIINLPLALFSGLFRPGIWDVSNFMKLIPALENSYLLVFTVIAIIKTKRHSVHIETKVLLFSLLVYILILAVLMAFAAPNFGTLMRYKIGFLPFLVYLINMGNPLFTKYLKS